MSGIDELKAAYKAMPKTKSKTVEAKEEAVEAKKCPVVPKRKAVRKEEPQLPKEEDGAPLRPGQLLDRWADAMDQAGWHHRSLRREAAVMERYDAWMMAKPSSDTQLDARGLS